MKRWLAYSISGLFTLVLFGVGFYILVQSGMVHFDWTDQWMRERAYEKAKKSNQRILVLGDSQLEHWPVDPCLYDALKDFCDENDVGYVNAAHYGFGYIEYLDQLRKIAPDYRPNLILVFVYTGNDLSDIVFRNDTKPLKRSYEVAFADEPDSQEKTYATENSGGKDSSDISTQFDWDFMRNKGISDTMIRYAKNRLAHPYEIGPQYVNPHLLVLGSWHPDFIRVNLTEDKVISKAGWFAAFKKLEGMVKLADSLNSMLCLIGIPSTAQVDTSHFDFYRQLLFELDDAFVYANAPQRNLYLFSREANLPYLDLLPYFKVSEDSKALYFENDDHLSGKGHALAFHWVENKILNPFIRDGLKSEISTAFDFHLRYRDAAIKQLKETIREDEVWFADIRKKAFENNLSVDSQLYLDARFVIEQESRRE